MSFFVEILAVAQSMIEAAVRPSNFCLLGDVSFPIVNNALQPFVPRERGGRVQMIGQGEK